MSEEGSQPAVEPRGHRPFLERPLALVALGGGLLGIVTAVLTLIKFPSSEESTQQRINFCKDKHGLSYSVMRDEITSDQLLFRGCVWPPPSGANNDGFTEITVTSHDGPGESEAEGLTMADVFTSSCRDIEVKYLFASQGTLVAEQPFRLTKGEMRRVEDGSIWMPRNEEEAALYSARRDESVVLSNTRYGVDTARCID